MQRGITVCAEVRPDDVVYCTLPLYHTNGGVLATGQMIYTGSTLVIRKKFSASNFWPDCIKYKCTVSRFSVVITPLLLLSAAYYNNIIPTNFPSNDQHANSETRPAQYMYI